MTYPVAWAYALEIEAHTGAEVVTLYISTSPALVTKATDTPPSFAFATGLVQPGNYSISCFAGGKTYGQSSIGYGEIVLNNDTGQFDYLMDWAFDGRPAVLRRIDASLVDSADYPDDWTTVYTGTLNQALPSFSGYNQGTISLQWRDRMVELQVPLPLAVFAGDNALPLGLEGTADDLKNKTKPLVLGQVYEMSPVCCNTAKLIYAVSPPTGGLLDIVTGWDAIADFDAVADFFGTILGASTHSGIANVTVYDSGVVIPQQTAYTDENDMMGNDPSAGYCRILHDRGYVRFGSIPAGTVTVSCTDNSGEANTIGNLIAAPLVNYMKWGAERYNAAEISALNTACPLAMGVMIQDSAMTVDQLLDLFCRSAGVCYYFDAPGVFRAFQIQNPADLTADFVLTDLQIAKVSRIDNEGIPAKAVRIRQQRCWTVQTSGLASSVTAARRAWVANEWRENLSHNIYTAQKHLLSETLGFETAFAVDAQTEADRRRDIYSVRRDFLEVELSPGIVDFTSLRLGMVCNLQLSGRFGYNAVNMLVIGIAADLANEKTTLSLWGDMSQHDYDITTADANTGSTMRAAINAAFQALAGNNSGATEPATKYPYMWWADTTSGYLKQRNAANSAWITVMLLATALMSNSDACDGFHASQTPGANQIPVLNSAGRLILGGTDDGISKAQVGGPLAIRSGSNSLVVGADASTTTLTDSTFKHGRISTPHYLTNEEPTTIAFITCGDAYNTLNIGGGSSVLNAATDIILYTADNYNTTTGTPRVRVLPSGRILSGITLPTDNGVDALQVNGTISSKGIKLDGTASSDVNTLDYYKEGTFTPVLIGLTTAGEGTYASQTGKYTRIGNVVNFTIHLAWTNHTGTGDMQITGLPFASTSHQVVANYANDLVIGTGKNLGTFVAGTTIMIRASDPTGLNSVNVAMDTAGTILVAGMYLI